MKLGIKNAITKPKDTRMANVVLPDPSPLPTVGPIDYEIDQVDISK